MRGRRNDKNNMHDYIFSSLVVVVVVCKALGEKEKRKGCSVADLFTKIANAFLKTFIESRIWGTTHAHTAVQDVISKISESQGERRK